MTKKAPRGTLPDWDRWPAGALPVLGCDPGEGTGVAVLAVPADSVFGRGEPKITVIWNDEITGPEKQQARQLSALAIDISLRYGAMGERGHRRPFPFVIEDFSLRIFTRDPALLTPVRLTAMIDILLEGHHASAPCQLFRQQAADPQRIVSDDMLKNWDLYAAGQKNARIAMKQAVYFLRRARKDRALRELAWGPPA